MRRRFAFPGALVLLLALCGIGWYAKTSDPASMGGRLDGSDADASPKSTCRKLTPRSNDAPLVQFEPRDSSRITVTAKCVSSTHSPVPNVKLSFRITDIDARVADINEAAATSAQGICHVHCDSGQRVRIEVTDDRWFAPPIEAVCTKDRLVEVKVVRCGTVMIRAEYDDGVPVTGLGELAEPQRAQFVRGGAPRMTRASGYSNSFALSAEGTATIRRAPIESALDCTLFCNRAGYQKSVHRIEPEQLAGNAEISLVVARAYEAGSLRVNFGDTGNLSGCRVVLEAEAGGQSIVPLHRADLACWESGKLKPNQRYRVTVVGPWAGRSEWIMVSAGQVTDVDLRLAAAGTVKVRLIDGAGKPIPNGCAQMGSALVSYSDGRPRLEDSVIAGNDGIVEVRGVPAGTVSMSAEAWGYQAVQFEAQSRPGGVTDIGDLILRPAEGEVTVVLTGAAEGQRYRVGIGQRFSTFVVVPPPVIDGNTYSLRGLSIRRYVVAVTLEAGGPAVSREFELTVRFPAETVYIDVAGLNP